MGSPRPAGTPSQGYKAQPPLPAPHWLFLPSASLLPSGRRASLDAAFVYGGIFNPSWLRNHGYFGGLWGGKVSRGEGIWEQFVETNLPFSSACGGVRNLSSAGTVTAGCRPRVQSHSHALRVYRGACVCTRVCGERGEVLPAVFGEP